MKKESNNIKKHRSSNKKGIGGWISEHVRPSVGLNNNHDNDHNDVFKEEHGWIDRLDSLKDKIKLKISFKWRF